MAISLYLTPFQSTLPQGERLDSAQLYKFLFAISIHAPTRGATLDIKAEHLFVYLFQSTLPQGERLQGGLITYYILHFNPRSHKGSDQCEV